MPESIAVICQKVTIKSGEVVSSLQASETLSCRTYV